MSKTFWTVPRSATMRWWQRVVCWFLPKYVAVDHAWGEDYSVALTYAVWRGKMYILRMDRLPSVRRP